MSISFETLYNTYEDTNNVCQFCKNYSADNVATRFLLIRSLDKPNLNDIIIKYSSSAPSGIVKDLTKQAYNSSVTIPQLLEYIESQRPAIVKSREDELQDIPDILSDFPIVNCGVRNDKVDDIVKYVVRDKSIKSFVELETAINSLALPRIHQYMLWSYYNQNSNDIIELFFLRHPNVIPTLRKIHDIDFFIKVGDQIIPFDLKFTHISDEYFDLFSEGIIDHTKDNTVFDNYETKGEQCELKHIKNFYSVNKRAWNLPKISGLSKVDLLQNLKDANQPTANKFIEEITQKRAEYVASTESNLQPLEWWNYKFQGERLFCNNNRLFVFLAYKNQFIDGRPLKGKTEEIGCKITTLLDNISQDSIHTINYHYAKDASLIGDYTALSFSTIFTE